MCDTFVALAGATCDGSLIFGKNSDREPNEAQILEYHPPKAYPPGQTVDTTYLTLPPKKYLNPVYARYWKKQNKKAGMDMS